MAKKNRFLHQIENSQIMNIHKILITFISISISLSCDNPFFPEIVDPYKMSGQRGTPESAIAQLFQSYETRRIELFTDVLSKQKFKFYIASDFDRSTKPAYKDVTCEKPDAFMECVDTAKFYYFWGYSAEFASTSKLFSNAEMIDIPSRPSISEIHYHLDSSGDTTYAEVKVKDVTFQVSRYENYNGAQVLVTYPIVNQPQVFLLERDSKNLWVISKWYDLGSEGPL